VVPFGRDGCFPFFQPTQRLGQHLHRDIRRGAAVVGVVADEVQRCAGADAHRDVDDVQVGARPPVVASVDAPVQHVVPVEPTVVRQGQVDRLRDAGIHGHLPATRDRRGPDAANQQAGPLNPIGLHLAMHAHEGQQLVQEQRALHQPLEQPVGRALLVVHSRDLPALG
jgi:hypothetical protein